MSRKTKYDITTKCRYGNLSVGAEKATISVTVERAALSVERLEPVVVGGRLNVLLRYDRNGQADIDGQQKLAETNEELQSVADCPSLQIKPSKLSFRLSFAVGAVDVKQLAAAAQMSGELSFTRIGDSGEAGDDD